MAACCKSTHDLDEAHETKYIFDPCDSTRRCVGRLGVHSRDSFLLSCVALELE